jgi:hypothetical protein
MMIGRENRSTRGKPAPVPLCPQQIPHALPGCQPGSPLWEASDYPLELWHGLGKEDDSLYSTAPIPALGPTQLPIQWITEGSFPKGKSIEA